MRPAPASYSRFSVLPRGGRRKRAEPPPKVTAEDLAKLEKSSLWCEACRTKFLNRETYDQHVKDHGKKPVMTKVARLKENRYEL